MEESNVQIKVELEIERLLALKSMGYQDYDDVDTEDLKIHNKVLAIMY